MRSGRSAVFGQENVLGFVDAGSKKRRAPNIGMNPLHKAAMGLSDLHRRGFGFKTKNLVGLLLGHAARMTRASMPRTVVRIKAFSPTGKAAIKIRL